MGFEPTPEQLEKLTIEEQQLRDALVHGARLLSKVLPPPERLTYTFELHRLDSFSFSIGISWSLRLRLHRTDETYLGADLVWWNQDTPGMVADLLTAWVLVVADDADADDAEHLSDHELVEQTHAIEELRAWAYALRTLIGRNAAARLAAGVKVVEHIVARSEAMMKEWRERPQAEKDAAVRQALGADKKRKKGRHL